MPGSEARCCQSHKAQDLISGHVCHALAHLLKIIFLLLIFVFTTNALFLASVISV